MTLEANGKLESAKDAGKGPSRDEIFNGVFVLCPGVRTPAGGLSEV